MSRAKRLPQRVMVPLLLFVGAAVAAGVAVPVTGQHVHANDVTWLPWALVAMGAGAILGGVFEVEPKIDGKARHWRSNAVVMIFGPQGARFVMAILGGAFLGGGVGLLMG